MVLSGHSLAEAAKGKVSKEGKACIGCHESQSPSFVHEWEISKHAEKGVDCFSCHKADKSDIDAMDHNGYIISILVTPKDCERCHAKEVKEMTSSHHAKAGDILNSLDNYLGEVVGGPEAVAVGCVQCHGAKVKVLDNGKLDTNSHGPTRALAGSILTDRSAPAPPAIPGTISQRLRPGSPMPAANAISAPTILK